MNILAFIGYPFLSAAAIHFIFTALLFARDRDQTIARLAKAMAFLYGLFCLAGGVVYIRARLSLSYSFFYRATWVGVLALPVASQMIALLVGSYWGLRRLVIRGSYFLWTAVFIACLTTDWVETGVASLVPFVDRTGPLEAPLRLIAAIQGLWVMAMAVRHRKRAAGNAREQTNYFLLGGIAYALAAVAAASVQLLSRRAFDPVLAAYLTLPWVAAVYYAVSRSRLADIQVALSKAAAAATIITVVGALHVTVFFLLARYVGTRAGILLATLVSAIVIFGAPIVSAMNGLGNRLSEKRTARREACLKESVSVLASLQSIVGLRQKTLDLVVRGLGVDDAGLLLPDDGGTYYFHAAEGRMREVRSGLPATSLVAQFLGSGQSVAVREEMRATLPAQDFEPMAREFDALRAETATAMTFQKALIGILVTGSKSDRRAFYPDDVAFLESVAGRSAAAIDNARLYEEATTDGLTKVCHRKYFLSRLRVEISRAKRHRRRLAVLFVDLDRFKSINDEHGHLAGDQVLRDVAALMLKHCREEDLICRYGGDEFVILLSDLREGEAMAVAERLRRTVEDAAIFQAVRLTISIGVREYGGGEAIPTDRYLLGEADAALYEAKKRGRNRVITSPLEGPLPA